MKRFLTAFFCLFLISINAQEAKFKSFYKANKNRTAFSLNLSSSFAGSFFDDEDDDEIKNLLKKSSDFKLMVFDKNRSDVAKDFKRFSRRNKLKTLIRAKDKGGKAEILFIEKNNLVREIIVKVTGTEDKLVLLGVKTKLTREELASIITSSNNEEVASK
ncbi:DUF4252 domain-containing protein [Tenacibaculum sp. nBUS_03]|uniref:DUF4252 domain-containing protein n=1 Tax=Tenacibaculum sp. nBUS_03 TaxID=3395320 RepID=UPI003EBFAD65